MSKLNDSGFLLVVVVPIAACVYLLVTLTPYLLMRDTWERDNKGRLMKLSKKLESEDRATVLVTAKEILEIIGERKLADPSLLSIQDEAKVLVKAKRDEQQSVEDAAKAREEKARLDQLAKLDREASDAEAQRTSEAEARRLAEAKQLEEEVHRKELEEREKARRQEKEEEYLKVVNGWLTDQEGGGDGSSFWDDPQLAKYLFGVLKWEFLSHRTYTYGNSQRAQARVRVWSTNQGGQPIVVVWQVDLKFENATWKIFHLMQR